MNARSACNKTHGIRDLIIEESLDILCISESWLSDHDGPLIADLLPSTHQYFHNPREEGKGGGVAMVVTRKISQAKSSRLKFNTFECLQVQFSQKGKSFIFYCIYRPPGPKPSFLMEFEEFILESQRSSSECIYIGDFNFWFGDSGDPDALRLSNILSDFNLKNHINIPTHEAGHILDLVITSHSCLILVITSFMNDPQ